MKKMVIAYLIIIIVVLISGCSSSQLESNVPKKEQPSQSKLEIEKNNVLEIINPYNYVDLSILPKKYTFEMARGNGDVVWTHTEAYNLERIEDFMDNIENGIEDMIRVTAFTKEGDAIVKDLEYDGEVINLTIDSTRDKFSENPDIEKYEFKRLVIEKRYSEDYRGTFIEYWLKNDEGENGKLIVQLFHKSNL